LQGDGYTYFPNRDNGESMDDDAREAYVFDNAVYKTELIFEGADAQKVKADIDQAVIELVEGSPNGGSELKHPPYVEEDDGTLVVKTKVKINGRKRDGGTFVRDVVILDAQGQPFADMVGSGSTVQLALTCKAWKGFGTVGLSLQPKAVLVHEAKQGGQRKSDPDYWADFFDANGEPAPASAPAAKEDLDF
jgi:hypothetical protein